MEDIIITTKNGHVWKIQRRLPEYTLWSSNWWCDDGGGVELYIANNNASFELSCFSGITASKIIIGIVDFEVFSVKAGLHDIEGKGGKSFAKRCVKIADYLCSLFCEYRTL